MCGKDVSPPRAPIELYTQICAYDVKPGRSGSCGYVLRTYVLRGRPQSGVGTY